MSRPRRHSPQARRAGTEHRSDCPISIALELVGDPWSLLVVRDAVYNGPRTFNDFLNAGEGVATNVLADRLQRLEAFDILSKHRDARDRRRFVYRLTAKGIDLAPVLVELALWSARHEKTAAPAATLRKMRENRERYVEGLRRAWEKSGR